MSLFYCLIIREDLTILCEYQQFSGNFVQALMPFIQKLESNVKDSFDYNKELMKTTKKTTKNHETPRIFLKKSNF